MNRFSIFNSYIHLCMNMLRIEIHTAGRQSVLLFLYIANLFLFVGIYAVVNIFVVIAPAILLSIWKKKRNPMCVRGELLGIVSNENGNKK